MKSENLPDMLRVEEAAAVLWITRSRVYEAAAVFQHTGGAAGIPSIRIGQCLQVPKRPSWRGSTAQLGDFGAA